MSEKPKKSKDLSPNPKRMHPKATKGTLPFEIRLAKVAFKGLDKTWEQLSKELGFETVTSLNSWRVKYAADIEEAQRESFREARVPIEKALVKSALGHREKVIHKGVNDKGKWGKEIEIYEPPNAKALDLYLNRFGALGGGNTDDSFDIFAGGYDPSLPQVKPLLHWDRSWGENGQDQIVGVMAGRGFGKTATKVRRALMLAKINRGREGMLLDPTYKMTANPTLQFFENALRDCKIPFTQNKTDKFYILWGDTKITFRSFDNVDTSGRGPTLAWMLIDEFREGEIYDFQTLAASVRDSQAKLRQIGIFSTPNGFDAMYDIFGDPDSKMVQSGKSVLYTGSTSDNYTLPKSYVDGLFEIYDERVIQQEFYGKFINVTQGQIYYNFSRSTHVGDYEFDPKLPIWIGQDFNYNPMCSVICQPHKGANNKEELWVVDELYMHTSSTDELCKELINRGYKPRKDMEEWITVYPDASGASKSAVSGSLSNIKIMESYGFTNVKHPRANPRILDRYNSVNGLLKNAVGDIRIKINGAKCKHLIVDLERESYKQGTQLRDDSSEESKMRGHLSDALGYPVHYNYRIESAYQPFIKY